MPPPKNGCPICAVQHPPDAPHDATSLYYLYRFRAARGRWPTWADALAHCKPQVRQYWEAELRRMDAWTAPDGEPIADPPAESINQAVPFPIQTTVVRMAEK
jgi:hypothetical protein